MKFLFECHFNDGTVLQQTEEDVSKIDPTRSAFYDVVQRNDDIAVFGIFNDQNTYAVDLRDGSFLVNNAKFTIPALVEKDPLLKFQLVYFRRHFHMTIMGSQPSEDLSHQVEFHLGWKTTVDDKEIQQTIIIT